WTARHHGAHAGPRSEAVAGDRHAADAAARAAPGRQTGRGHGAPGNRAHGRAAPVARGPALGDRGRARHGLRPFYRETGHRAARRTRARRGFDGPGAERSTRHRGLPGRMTSLAVKALTQFYGGSRTLWDVELAVPAGSRTCI